MKCPECGNENREGARFCDSCGATLQAEPEAKRSAADEPLPSDAPRELSQGRYLVKRFLGQGGRKRVFLAEDAGSGTEVAVAIFNTEGVAAAVQARARREAQAMGRLGDHPHVVRVFDTGEHDGDPYIVSEYMAGGDVEGLLDATESRRLEIGRAGEIAADVCRALEHAHGRGIIHRDLKPANVWLDDDGAARLGDFGLATTEGRSRVSEGTLVGTVAYLPPEQALGKRSDARSDLYSLGALMYEMLTGQPPFPGDEAVAIISQHLHAEPVPPSRQRDDVPGELDQLVLALLAKDGELRPASAAQARERLVAAAKAPPAKPAEGGDSNPLESLAGGVFVGREAELERLRETVDGALGGRGGLVLLVGEPGIGKTRTADELATYARVNGARLHWGRCREEEGAPAYWPWVQAMRSYVREADPVALGWEMGGGAADVAQLVPEAAERLGELPALEEVDPEQARFRLFDSVTTFLTAAARDRPMVLVLDDLHWADEPSLQLLRFAARELGDTGLLIVGTYRDVALGRHHPLAAVLSELSGLESSQRVTLRGLDAQAVSRYMTMSAGAEPPAELAKAVHERTEGNPFFVGEVVRLLVSEGALSDGDGARSGSWELTIPEGVREVVGRRLDGLSDEANEVLKIAAAVGREFDLELLQSVCEQDPDQTRAAVEGAVAALLVTEAGSGRYCFDHALVRETLYEEVTGPRRLELHRRIGEALERHWGDEVDSHLDELARHFLEAAPGGDRERAIDYATRAGAQAIDQLAYEEAADDYARALEVLELDQPDPRRRCRLLLDLGGAEARCGRLVQARETFGRAADAARALDDADALAEAGLGLSRVSEAGNVDELVVSAVEDALEALPEGDSAERAELTGALAQEVVWTGDPEKAGELAREGAEMARRVGEPRTRASTLARLIFVITLGPEGAEERMQIADEISALGESSGEREYALRGHFFRLREYLELGDMPNVDRELNEFARVAQELRIPQWLWRISAYRCMRALIDGDLEAAERLAGEARAGGERAQEPLANQLFAIQLLQVRRLQGRVGELREPVRAMAERYPALPAWRMALADIQSLTGDVEAARVEFERFAAEEFSEVPEDAQWLAGMTILGEVCAAVGDAERAEVMYDRLLPYRELTIVVGPGAVCQGPVARILGLLAQAGGDAAKAERHFEAALELATRMGDKPHRAMTQLNLAELLLDRDGRGDRDRALELLGECLESSRRIDARGISDPALTLRLEAQGLAGVDVTTSIDDVISAVESERPDLRRHAAPDGTVTILFSDIEDSTLITERLGDERWLKELRAHNAVFRDQVRRHDGFEVKSQGDGFMLAFPDPRAAVECAIAVQRAFAARVEEGEGEPLRVRMGLHTGEVIAEEGDFFGKNVILAARIAARAGGGEILVSSPLKEAASNGSEDGELRFDDGRELELKGLAGTHTVYRAEWEPQAAAA